MSPKQRIVVTAAIVMAWTALAGDAADELAGTTESAGERAIAQLRVLRPELPIQSVKESPIPGLYQAELSGGQMLYASADGRYLLTGELYELTDTSLVSLTEKHLQTVRLELMADIDPAKQIIFTPQSRVSEVKAVVNVFTDVDCTYCRKLHQNMAGYHERGIEVRYLAYPRSGIGTKSYDRFVSAWCAKNPQIALTKLKAGKAIPDATCENPVAEQYELGQAFGVTGTPSILLPDGRMLPGLLGPEPLAAELGI